MTTQAEYDAAVAEAHRSIDKLASLKVGPVVVDPPPPPPPPPPSGLIPTTGLSFMSHQFNVGPADWIDPAKKLPTPPWSVYSDPAKQIFAPSQNGVRPTRWMRLTPWGGPSQLYDGNPIYHHGKVIHYSTMIRPAGGDTRIAASQLKADPPPVGARGTGLVDPFITWHGHPVAKDDGSPGMGPLYLGLRADGALLALMPDGSSFILGWIDVTGCMDFSFTPDRMVFLVADTYGGRVLKIDRTAARAARVPPAHEDYKLWTVTVLADNLGTVTSVRCLPDGKIYAIDNKGGRVLEISNGVRVVCSFPAAFWVDYVDTQLVVMTNNSRVHMVDPVTGNIGLNMTPAHLIGGAVFVTLSVDHNGTIGTKGDIYGTAVTSGGGNTDILHYSGGKFITNFPFAPLEGTPGEPLHYGWVTECHPEQAVFLAQGVSNFFPSLIRPRLPTDPEGDIRQDLYGHGYQIHCAGGPIVGQYPSGTALMNPSGWGNLGCNVDHIAELGYAEMAAFFRGGLTGSIPRVLSDYDVLGWGEWALAHSQRYIKEGGALTRGWRAHMGNPPVTPTPVLIGPVAGRFISCGATNVGLHDGYGGTYAMDPATVVKVVADKGMPFEKIIGTLTSPWTLTPLNLPPGQHGLSCEVESGQNYQNKTVLIEV